jgi:hypothetical protein
MIEGLYVDAYRIYAIFRDDPFSFMLEKRNGSCKFGTVQLCGSNPFKVLKSKHDEIQLIAIDTDSQIISDTEIKRGSFLRIGCFAEGISSVQRATDPSV